MSLASAQNVKKKRSHWANQCHSEFHKDGPFWEMASGAISQPQETRERILFRLHNFFPNYSHQEQQSEIPCCVMELKDAYSLEGKL